MGHKSSLTEAVRLSRYLMERGIRLIVFCPVRDSSPMQVMRTLRYVRRSGSRVNWSVSIPLFLGQGFRTEDMLSFSKL